MDTHSRMDFGDPGYGKCRNLPRDVRDEFIPIKKKKEGVENRFEF